MLTDAAAKEMGENVRRFRRARGWTQGRLGEEAGVSRDAVLRIEKGHARTRPSTIAKVAEALDLEYRDLLAEPDPVPAGAEAAADLEDAEREILALARRTARAEGISENEALGRLYKQHLLFERTRPRKRFGLPRGERPVMGSSNAAAEALSAVRGN